MGFNVGVSVFVTFILIMILLWSVRMLNVIWWRPKKIEKMLKKQGIYGHPYRLLYGNSKEMVKVAQETGSKRPLTLSHDLVPRLNPFLQKLALTYCKKVFVVWYGTTPRVTILDPKLIREILHEKFTEFEKPELNSTMKLFLTGLANINGDKWAKHRRIINPAFHTEKLKCMLPAFSICIEEMVEKWDKAVAASSDVGGEVDAALEFENLTANVISRAAFGSSFEEGKLIFLLQKEQGQLFLHSHLNATFPWLRFMPTQVNKRMRQIYKEVRIILRGIIEKREKTMQLENDRDDLLGLLLKSNLNEIQKKKNHTNAGLTTEDVIEECKLFYFAGQETTASLLTWTMVALSMHKDWQDRAREEVRQIIGKNKPNFGDLNSLKIVNMILLEVLRLYPPTSFVRIIQKDTKLGNFTLPAGIQLHMPLEIIHRDPEIWGEDALQFNPERFSDGVSKASKDQISLFPFGWGPRVCIGQNFAMLEVKLAMSLILQNFWFQLSPTYIHAPCIDITLQPEYGAPIILHKI